jgi:hypothetical protein
MHGCKIPLSKSKQIFPLPAMLEVHAYKLIATGVMEKRSVVGSSLMQIASQIYKVIVKGLMDKHNEFDANILSRERFCPSPKASEGQLHAKNRKHADRY